MCYFCGIAIRASVVASRNGIPCIFAPFYARAYEFNKDRLLIGHGDKSAIIAAMLIPDLTDEEMLC